MMDKVFKSAEVEGKIYKMWEEGRYFTPKSDKSKKPFSIILPLPNASDPMHMGHALFTVEDVLIRYHRMLGEPTLWLPGGDHAGIETQYIFEKHLAKIGKSRFDFDRETLYNLIWEFTQKNKDINKDQMKRLGFSMDWTRYHYSLEPEIVERVFETFRKLHSDGLIYRGERIVNFCTKCGTAFSELEVNYVEREDKLYYLDYGTVQIATTRPETIFADVAVAVNPTDIKYKDLIGKKATIPLINVEIPVITSEEIDVKFGTGALKVTPGYDAVDFEIGQRNSLETLVIIDRRGKLLASPRVPSEIVGLNVKQAREKTVELLKGTGRLVKEEALNHSVGSCYRCGTTIEPMVIPQWFVRVKSLANKAIEAIKNGETEIVPEKRFEKMYFDWMENIKDWNISRQIVWGPRIPVWYCLDCNPGIVINEINGGVQSIIVEKDATYQLSGGNCESCGGSRLIQETDTFDTWFLSGQWPVNTLKAKEGDLEYFYPTSVLDTLWDILFFWVGRMMMLGIYLTGKVPFKTVHIHSRVVDKQGVKMSKSKGNVLDPILMVDKYGADALRMALVIGVAPASDIAISEEKIKGQRNFSNKLWNISRFVLLNLEGKEVPWYEDGMDGLTAEDKNIIQQLNGLIRSTTRDLDNYRFGSASENLYQFIWHEFADKYLEIIKERRYKNVLFRSNPRTEGQTTAVMAKKVEKDFYPTLSVVRHVFLNCLKLLHPFMPFVTEEIWGKIPGVYEKVLMVSKWPEVEK
jgi:valyl-tRNA synthetase